MTELRRVGLMLFLFGLAGLFALHHWSDWVAGFLTGIAIWVWNYDR